jgi:hypothetical protein
MEQRRKIIIPTGAEAVETPETPHFDAEETLLSARPVVPLTTEEGVTDGSDSAHRAAPSALSRSFPLLALIVVAGICVGLVGGFAIARYQSRQNAQASPLTTEPPAATAGTQLNGKNAGQAEATSIKAVNTTNTTDDEKVAEQTAEIPKSSGATDDSEERPAREKKDDVKEVVAPTVKREKTREKERDEEAEEKAARKMEREEQRAARREERRAERRREREARGAEDDRARFERAGREQINRVREIFEGTP